MASSKKINASIVLGGTITGALKGALGSAEAGLKKIGQAVSELSKKQRELANDIATFSKLGKNVDHLNAQYAAVTAQVDKLRIAQGRLARASAARQANIDRRGQLRGQLGEATAIGAAVILPVAKAIKDAAEYDKQMTLIGNTADLTKGQTDALGRTFIEVSARTGQSAQNLQKAGGFLIAAGLDVGRAAASVETIGRTATASGADIEDLAKAAFTLTDALKIEPKGLQRGLDILSQAGKEGNVELKDMARTLPALGSSFQALKMTGDEAVATLGAALEIARKGAADPDEAANNMRNYLAKVLSPETLKKAKKNFNLDLYKVITDAQKTGGNPFEASVAAIMKATQGDQKKLGDLFQDMQVQNFLRPMMQNWEKYQDIKKKSLNGGNVTDRDLAKVSATAKQQMDRLGQSVGRLSIVLGQALTPEVGKTADSLANMVDRMAVFTEKNPKLVGGVVKAVAAFAAFRLAGVALGYAFTFIKAPFLALAETIAKFRAGGVVGALGKAGPAFARFGTVARAAMLGIVGVSAPVLAVVAAIGVAAFLVWKYWQPIKAFFQGFGQGVMSSVAPALGKLGEVLAPLKPAWDAIASAVGSVWEWVEKLIQPFQATKEQLDGARASGESFGQVVGKALGLVVKGIAWAINNFIKLGEAIGTVAGFVAVEFPKAWDTLKEKVGAVIDWIMSKLQPLIKAMQWVGEKAGSIGSAISQRNDEIASNLKASWLGRAWDHMAGSGSSDASGTAASVLPMRGGGSTTNNHVSQPVSFQIYQQPGQDANDLTDVIRRNLEKHWGTQARGSLVDGAQH